MLIKGRLELSVSDSGKGFDASKIDDWLLTGAHLGIIGMQERIKGLNGEFTIQAEPGHGVQIKASIPIN
ncbi:MAG: hypothetical protein QHH75_05370 [Bacillota bacterium]|nr:hypothetical protein [Bacillota bacterium]